MRELHHADLLISAHSGGAALLRSTHAVIIGGGVPETIQILPLGTFYGRDGRGPFKIASKADAQKIIDSSLALAAGADLPIDYDHQTDYAAVPGVGGTAIAAGWIKALEARDDGIWARVEWTEAAAAHLRAKEYRYISPVYAHSKTGVVSLLLRAGLTNNPNLELKAVASAQHQEDDMDFIAKLRKALGLPETTSEEDVLALASRLQLHSTSFTALATAAGLKLDDKSETVTAIAAAIGAKVKGFDAAATAAGLKADDKPEQLAVAINAGKAAGTVDPTKFVPVEQVVALQSQLNELKTSVNSDKSTAAVDKAIQAGKLIPGLRDWGISLHSSNPAEFDKFVAAAPVVLKPGTEELLVSAAAGADGLTDDERAICSAMGVSPEDFKKNKEA